MTSIADVIEQESITTGTGAYTVSGTVAFRRTFLAAFPANASLVPCVVVDSAGAFETGLYAWDYSALTLTRTLILTSSNANAAVNWAAGTRRIYCGSSSLLSKLAALRHNLEAVAAPTANDDVGDGYQQGSWWYYNSALYICESPNTAAAIWRRVAVPTGAGLAVEGSYNGAETANYFFNRGLNWRAAADPGPGLQADGGVGPLAAFTANATPKLMAYDDDYGYWGGIYMTTKMAAVIAGEVVAIDKATGDTKAWKVEAVVRTNGAGVTTILAGSAPSVLHGDGGASGWSIAVVNAGTSEPGIEVTGEAATDIAWSANLRLVSASYS